MSDLTTRYYDDPLAAAYMAREFGVKYQYWCEDDKEFYNIELRPFSANYDEFYPEGDDYQLNEDKYYIHPDSYHILQPHNGDAGSDAKGFPLYYSDYFKVDDFYWHYSMGATGVVEKIIQRDDKQFFEPKQEQSQ